MGLINLQTNLKSLRYGKDRVYGGDSGQPYIQKDIPEQVGEFGFLNQDFVLRGGSKAVTDSALDVERLGKYFLDIRNPSGLLFIAKQNLLSRTAVRTQASTGLLNEGIYTPLSTLAEAGGVAFGLHVNKQGLNPFGDSGGITKYEDATKKTNTNFSTSLTTINISGAGGLNFVTSTLSSISLVDILKVNRLIGLWNNQIVINNEDVNVLSYPGGPGAPLGIGSTYIKFAKNNNGAPLKTNSTTTNTTLNSFGIDFLSKINSGVRDQIINNEFQTAAPPTPVDFRKNIRLLLSKSTILSNAPSYNPAEGKTLEARTNLGDPGNPFQKNLISYTYGFDIKGEGKESKGGAASPNSYDKINVYPLYQSNPDDNKNKINRPELNDLILFKIGVISNNPPTQITNIHFRAFLNQINDTYTSEWKDSKYIGRGEKFYTYSGFDRKVSLSWTVAAQSKAELIPMYQKLNYLASVCAPDYSPKGYMRGNFITLTIGDYFKDQPGIMTGFSYEMNDANATWEIGIDDVGENDSNIPKVPHLIKVSGFNFIPIHNFAPRIQENTFDEETGKLKTYGNQNFISLI